MSLKTEENVIRCTAPRRNARFAAELCNGFVGRFPTAYHATHTIQHSSEAEPGNIVCACRRCGQLYELERVRRVA